MSWKGVTKAISRLPHQMMGRKQDATVDEDFVRLEKRFNDIVQHINALRQQSGDFRDAIAALLEHQMNCAITIEEIYALSEDVPAEPLQASQDYGAAMTYCRNEILEQLDQLDSQVVQPAEQAHTITKDIQKTIVKRQHKLIDYDRFRVALQKYQTIQDRSPSEEKQIFKLESQLATATQDYEYLNDMLKQDLVRFIRLAAEFITPIQTAFFHLQCGLIGGMYGRIYEVAQNKAYFTTIDQSLEGGYAAHVAQHNVRAELESLDILNKGIGSKNSMIRPAQATLRERAATAPSARSGSSTPHTSLPMQSQHETYQDHQNQQQQQQRRPPPVPPSRNTTATYVIALYDLDAQQEGDLEIRANDRIEVLERTEDAMDWWKGRIGNRVGMFPGNYVQEI